MLSVGLTGGIASGKSLAARLFQQRGAFLIDADSVARQVVMPGSPGLQRVVEAFGPGVVDSFGALDRKKLGAAVFSDAQLRTTLDAILHPLILDAVFSAQQDLKQQGYAGIVIADVPLLYECGLQTRFDATVLVYTDPATQMKRLQERNGLAPAQARQRLSAQMAIEDKRRLADFIIDNTGSPADLVPMVADVWTALRQLQQNKA